MNLTFIVLKVGWPVVSILSLSIALPYILFIGVLRSSGNFYMAQLCNKNKLVLFRFALIPSCHYCLPLLFSILIVVHADDRIGSVWVSTM